MRARCSVSIKNEGNFLRAQVLILVRPVAVMCTSASLTSS